MLGYLCWSHASAVSDDGLATETGSRSSGNVLHGEDISNSLISDWYLGKRSLLWILLFLARLQCERKGVAISVYPKSFTNACPQLA